MVLLLNRFYLQELMHLIDLDVAVFEMFDLPPMNEYDLYIKNFGRSDTTQVKIVHNHCQKLSLVLEIIFMCVFLRIFH